MSDTDVKISIKKLKRIAEYYQFPFAVFFMPEDKLPKKEKRLDALLKSHDAILRIKEIIEELEPGEKE